MLSVASTLRSESMNPTLLPDNPTDKDCLFCNAYDAEVVELTDNTIHRWTVGYICLNCKCLWNDETAREWMMA